MGKVKITGHSTKVSEGGAVAYDRDKSGKLIERGSDEAMPKPQGGEEEGVLASGQSIQEAEEANRKATTRRDSAPVAHSHGVRKESKAKVLSALHNKRVVLKHIDAHMTTMMQLGRSEATFDIANFYVHMKAEGDRITITLDLK